MKKLFPKKHRHFRNHLDASGQQGVFDEKTFLFVLKRECVRADRAGRRFSVLELRLPESRGKCSEEWILNVLAKRIRITDIIGWLDCSTLGVLLTDTSGEGSFEFLNRIIPPISDGGSVPDIQIHTYPNDMGDRGFSFNNPDGDEFGETHFDQSGNADLFFPDRLSVASPLVGQLSEMLIVGAALLFLSPLFLLISLTIKVSSPGPIFFRQERVGRRGRTFYCYKFRTMHRHSETEKHEEYFSYLMKTAVPMLKLDNSGDSRIFPAGHLLRASSLDELPQLINIVKGEMRLIGPRPCTPHEYEQYRTWHRHRTDALPGLTGLWQVSGKNKTTFDEMIRLDLRYIKEKSVLLDLWIILKTMPVVVVQFLEDRELKKNSEELQANALRNSPFLNAVSSSSLIEKSKKAQKKE